MKAYTTRKTGKSCYDILNLAGGELGSAFKEPGSAGYLGIVETPTKTYMTGGDTIAQAAEAVAKLHAVIYHIAPELPKYVTLEATAWQHGEITGYRLLWRGLEIATVVYVWLGGLWSAEPLPHADTPPDVAFGQRAKGRDADHAARVFFAAWLARGPASLAALPIPADLCQASMF